MRKLLVTLVLILFFYLAGLYRSSSVIIFLSASLVFMAILGILSKYLVRRLEIGLEPERNTVSKESTMTMTLATVNHSRVPVMKFEVRLKIWNQGTSNAETKKIQGYVPGKGTARIGVEVSPKHCGILEISGKKAKVWDPLCLFCGQKKTAASFRAVVLPKGYEMQFSMESLLFGMESENGNSRPGAQPPEIYQVQAYRPGDGLRDIHWKLTARSGELLSKQYCAEVQAPVFVFWDIREDKPLSTEQMDAFWELCYGVSAGLLKEKVSHSVGYWDRQTGLIQVYSIACHEDIMNNLCEMIRRDALFEEKGYPDELYLKEMYQRQEEGEMALSIDTSLRLHLYNKLLFQFSEEDYVEEIKKEIFLLS